MEVFLKGKSSEAANEDRIVVTPYYIGVIDGATSKSDFRKEEMTTGQWAGRLVEEAVKSLPPSATGPDAVSAITRRMACFYTENSLWERVCQHPEQRLTASAVLYSCHRKEVWMVGDCQCLIGGRAFTNGKQIDTLLAEVRSVYLEARLLQGISQEALLEHDTGRDCIRPFLVEQSVFQNLPSSASPYAYAVFDGFPLPPSALRILPVAPGEQVVLASDGYPRLFPTLAASERYLHELLQKDPLCIRSYKSTKGMYKGQCSFDDRAYVSFLS